MFFDNSRITATSFELLEKIEINVKWVYILDIADYISTSAEPSLLGRCQVRSGTAQSSLDDCLKYTTRETLNK